MTRLIRTGDGPGPTVKAMLSDIALREAFSHFPQGDGPGDRRDRRCAPPADRLDLHRRRLPGSAAGVLRGAAQLEDLAGPAPAPVTSG